MTTPCADTGSSLIPVSERESPPNVAHQLHVLPKPPSESKSDYTSTDTEGALFSNCEEVKYDSRNSVDGVSYRTNDGKDQWTPVVKRRKLLKRMTGNEGDVSNSTNSGSELDLSCSRLVKYEKHDGVPLLAKRLLLTYISLYCKIIIDTYHGLTFELLTLCEPILSMTTRCRSIRRSTW